MDFNIESRSHGFFFNPDSVFVFTTDFTDLTDFSLTQITFLFLPRISRISRIFLSPQITFLFLPRISRISRIFLSTARIANPTERQYPLNPCHPCSLSFSFVFYHGFHRFFFNPDYVLFSPRISQISRILFSASSVFIRAICVLLFYHGFHGFHGFFSASFVSSISHLAKESVLSVLSVVF